MPVSVLGISAYYHDSAAALVVDGEIVAAAQEERFTRQKHDSDFPRHAIAYCLQVAGATLGQIDQVVFYDKPLLKFERLLETYVAYAPRGFRSFRVAMPIWLREKLYLKDLLRNRLREFDADFDPEKRLLFSEHHLSHAASAFFPSPFDRALVLTMDGVGEWTTTSLAVGDANTLEIRKEIRFPHSLGLLYSAFTYYTGFKVNSGEYKVMGLAPYGKPRYAQTILDHLIDLKPDGSFHLDLSYFDYCTGLTMTGQRFHDLFGGEPRHPRDPIAQRHMDLAASIQAVTEEAMVRLVRTAVQETGLSDVCLAGGVALNCVGNGRILRESGVRNLWVQPAAGDAGGAVGAALSGYHQYLGHDRLAQSPDAMQGSLLGPEFSQTDIEHRLDACGARYRVLDESTLLARCAQAIAGGSVLGWFQGRMEFGPRALGGRSILADPRGREMQAKLNLKIKFRESFRPFAPSVLREHVSEWFALDRDSPYMLLVADVTMEHRHAMTADADAVTGFDRLQVPRSDIPAVTHVDYSARIQTVDAEVNPRFHRLITRFRDLAGCPILVNTSFNVRGEPIVCTPEDAFRCFMGTDMDMLAIGNCLLDKRDQDPSLALDYRNRFDQD